MPGRPKFRTNPGKVTTSSGRREGPEGGRPPARLVRKGTRKLGGKNGGAPGEQGGIAAGAKTDDGGIGEALKDPTHKGTPP